MTGARTRTGLTITELVVVLVALATLVAAGVPVVARQACDAGKTTSMRNLVRLARAHASYAADWNDRQFTLVRDDLGAANGDCETYQAEVGCHPPVVYGDDCDGVTHGVFFGCGGGDCSAFPIVYPLDFDEPDLAVAFRLINVRGFHEYVGGRFYDRTFYAPKDAPAIDAVTPLLAEPCEFVPLPDDEVVLSSYAMSPSAMFHPDVFRAPSSGGFQHPDSLEHGYASPPASQAVYPDLKTRMIEHSWLQAPPGPCNTALEPCTPYLFNHGYESRPLALFYDGHVRVLSAWEASLADNRVQTQTGGAETLWSRDTPLGESGYFLDVGWDYIAKTSYHVLTTGGITGRDTVR